MTFYSGKHKSQKLNDRKDPDSTSVIVSQESPGICSLVRQFIGVPFFQYLKRKESSIQEPYTIIHGHLSYIASTIPTSFIYHLHFFAYACLLSLKGS